MNKLFTILAAVSCAFASAQNIKLQSIGSDLTPGNSIKLDLDSNGTDDFEIISTSTVTGVEVTMALLTSDSHGIATDFNQSLNKNIVKAYAKDDILPSSVSMHWANTNLVIANTDSGINPFHSHGGGHHSLKYIGIKLELPGPMEHWGWIGLGANMTADTIHLHDMGFNVAHTHAPIKAGETTSSGGHGGGHGSAPNMLVNHVHTDVTVAAPLNLDINGDGTDDFTIRTTNTSSGNIAEIESLAMMWSTATHTHMSHTTVDAFAKDDMLPDNSSSDWMGSNQLIADTGTIAHGGFAGNGMKFIGVRMAMMSGMRHWAWIAIEVNAAADTVHVHKMAFNQAHGFGPIMAGDERSIAMSLSEPNGSDSHLTFSNREIINLSDFSSSVQLIDLSGKSVLEISIAANSSIKVTEVPGGIYLLKSSTEARFLVKKILIN